MLKDKVALVTGSARGIGKSILYGLAQEDCFVILHYKKSSKEVQEIIKQFRSQGKKIKAYRADLTNKNESSQLFKQIKKDFGKLDILVNNVGNYLNKNLDDLTIREWHYIIDSNLHSTFYCIKNALPLLRKSSNGRIINIGYASSGIMVAKPNVLSYQIAKTGVLLMTRAYAKTEAKNKILVNMISPGYMENSVDFSKKLVPLKKRGSLKELTNLVIETIKNNYMTGAHIEYNGGFGI